MHALTTSVNIKCQPHWYWQEFLPRTLIKSSLLLNPILPNIYRGDNQSTVLPQPHSGGNAGQKQSTACKDCTNAWLVNRLKFARVTACQKRSNKISFYKKSFFLRFKIKKMSKQGPGNVTSAVGIRVTVSGTAQLAFSLRN